LDDETLWSKSYTWRKSAAGLFLVIDTGQLLPGAVDYDKVGVVEFFDRPRGGKRRA
jgi:hypothetical protein